MSHPITLEAVLAQFEATLRPDYRQLATDLARAKAKECQDGNELSGGVESRHAQRTRSRDGEECSGEKPNCKSAGSSSNPADASQTLAGVMSSLAETSRSRSSDLPAQFISEPEQPYPLGGIESAKIGY